MKRIIALSSILIVLVIGLVITLLSNTSFRKPSFDRHAIKLKDNSKFIDKLVNVKEGYSFYINGNPSLKDNYLNIDFYSNTSDSIYLKVRIYDGEVLIGESGLIKSGEYVKKIMIDKIKSNNLSYLIMSYEKDTYYSLGEVKLHFEIGDNYE